MALFGWNIVDDVGGTAREVERTATGQNSENGEDSHSTGGNSENGEGSNATADAASTPDAAEKAAGTKAGADAAAAASKAAAASTATAPSKASKACPASTGVAASKAAAAAAAAAPNAGADAAAAASKAVAASRATAPSKASKACASAPGVAASKAAGAPAGGWSSWRESDPGSDPAAAASAASAASAAAAAAACPAAAAAFPLGRAAWTGAAFASAAWAATNATGPPLGRGYCCSCPNCYGLKRYVPATLGGYNADFENVKWHYREYVWPKGYPPNENTVALRCAKCQECRFYNGDCYGQPGWWNPELFTRHKKLYYCVECPADKQARLQAEAAFWESMQPEQSNGH